MNFAKQETQNTHISDTQWSLCMGRKAVGKVFFSSVQTK